MKGNSRPSRGHEVLNKTWSVVKHLVDDVEPDRISTIAPIQADGNRAKPFSQN